MSKYQHKPNSGSLFKNDNRDKETSPQMRGSALIGGVEYWVSAWTNTKDNGERWQGLRFNRKDEQRMPRQESMPKAPEYDTPYDDEIPF